eukprot:18166-Heterococcus_DN1.PRE.2
MACMILLWKSTRVDTYVDFHLGYTAERCYCSLHLLLVLLLLLILEKTQCYCYCVGGAAALAQMLVVLSDALTASAIVRDVSTQLSYMWQLRDINEAKNNKVLTSVKEIVKETQQCLYIKTSVHSISRCTLRYSCDATQTCMANSINRHIIGIVHMNLSSKMNRCNCNE